MEHCFMIFLSCTHIKRAKRRTSLLGEAYMPSIQRTLIRLIYWMTEPFFFPYPQFITEHFHIILYQIFFKRSLSKLTLLVLWILGLFYLSEYLYFDWFWNYDESCKWMPNLHVIQRFFFFFQRILQRKNTYSCVKENRFLEVNDDCFKYPATV